MLLTSSRFHCFCSNVYVQSCILLFPAFCQFHCLKKEKDPVPRVRIELTTFRFLLYRL